MDRFLSRYAALCVLSLFLGINYEIGLVLRPFDAIVAAGGLILVGRTSVRGSIDTLRKPAVYYLFAATYFYRCFNAIFLSGTGVFLKETIQVIEFLLLVHLIAVSTRTEEDRRLFFRTLLVGSGFMAVLAGTWHVGNGYYTGYKELGDPKYIFSLFGLLAFWKYLLDEPSRFSGVVLLVAAILTVLSGERKGWVALVVGGGLMYFLFRGGSIKEVLLTILSPRVLIGGGALLTGVIALGLQFEYTSRQFESLGDIYILLSSFDLQMDLSAFETTGSNLARLYILLFTIRTVLAHPWFGVGTERWSEAIAEAAGDSRFATVGAHSEYQRFAVENGFTGLVLYIGTWIVCILQALRLVRNASNSTYKSCLGVLGLSGMGATINLFLGGGALNILYMALPVGLITGLNDKK